MIRYEKRQKLYRGSMQPEHYLTFDSYAEFITACNDQKATSRNLGFIGGGINNFAGADYDTAYRYATSGYDEGVNLLKLKLENLDISSHVAKPEFYFDVTGDYGYDMGLVLSGEPESAIAYRESENYHNAKSGPVINMLVNTVMSAGISKDVIAHRGAAIVSLVNALESSGKRVQIDVICSASMTYERLGLFTHMFPLKNAGESLTIENIAFALAHPAIERRFNFIALDLFPKSCGWSTKKSYGGPIDVSHEGYDVYVPMLDYDNENWQTIDTVNAWLTAMLHKLGITLDADKTV